VRTPASSVSSITDALAGAHPSAVISNQWKKLPSPVTRATPAASVSTVRASSTLTWARWIGMPEPCAVMSSSRVVPTFIRRTAGSLCDVTRTSTASL
jgi:hypothetical protein